MPGKIKVKILAARNLPIMDRSAETTDAFCEVKLGTTTYKTDVYRKSLNPQWNSEWYRFEMDDAELQDEPLQIRVMDHDTYSANDAIGKLYLDLNPLLHLQCMYPTAKTIDASAPPVVTSMPSGSVLSGWFPVYDTMHGIRGEVHVTVKVELFSDFNKFRESSCGVQFFSSSGIPYGHNALAIHGFVEELIKTSDPEYQWIEKIRTPRVTNEARQTTFFKLSGEVHRKIGLKVIDMGGNAVIGYIQCFDLEGESGIVVRGIGTVVTLVKIPDPISTSVRDTSNEEDDSTQFPVINIIPDSPTQKDSPYIPPKRHPNGRKLYSRFSKKTNPFFMNSRLKLGRRPYRHSHEHKFVKKESGSGEDSSSLSSFRKLNVNSRNSKKFINAIRSSSLSLSKSLSESRKELQDADGSRSDTISFLVASLTKDPVFNFGHVYSSIEEESVANLSLNLSKNSSRSNESSESELGTASESSSIMTEISQSFYDGASDGNDAFSSNLIADDKLSLNVRSSSTDVEIHPRMSPNIPPNECNDTQPVQLSCSSIKVTKSFEGLSNFQEIPGVEDASTKKNVCSYNVPNLPLRTGEETEKIFSEKVELRLESCLHSDVRRTEKFCMNVDQKKSEIFTKEAPQTDSQCTPSAEKYEALNEEMIQHSISANNPRDFRHFFNNSTCLREKIAQPIVEIVGNESLNVISAIHSGSQSEKQQNSTLSHTSCAELESTCIKIPEGMPLRISPKNEFEQSTRGQHDQELKNIEKQSIPKSRAQKSNTPPLSEMEPYEMPPAQKPVDEETLYSSQSGIHHMTVTGSLHNAKAKRELKYIPLNDSSSTEKINLFKSMPDLRLQRELKSKAEYIKYQQFIDQASSCYKTGSMRKISTLQMEEGNNSVSKQENVPGFISNASYSKPSQNLQQATSVLYDQEIEKIVPKSTTNNDIHGTDSINSPESKLSTHKIAQIFQKSSEIFHDVNQRITQTSSLNFSMGEEKIDESPLCSGRSNLWGGKNIIHDLKAYCNRNIKPESVPSPTPVVKSIPLSHTSPFLSKFKTQHVRSLPPSWSRISNSVDQKLNYFWHESAQTKLKHCNSSPLFSTSCKSPQSCGYTLEFNALTLNNSDLTLNLAKNLLNSVAEKQRDAKDSTEGMVTSSWSSKIDCQTKFCDGVSKIVGVELSDDFSKLKVVCSNSLSFSGCAVEQESTQPETDCSAVPPCHLQLESQDSVSRNSSKSETSGSTSESQLFGAQSLPEPYSKFIPVSDYLPANSTKKNPDSSKFINIYTSSLDSLNEFGVSHSTNRTLPPRPSFSDSSSTQGICKSGDGEGDVSVGQTIPQSLTPSASKILSQSPAKIAHPHRRSSDSELSVTPKGNSLTGSSGTGMNRTFLPNILLQPITDKKMFELHDYPFLTMTRYPPGFIKRLGGTVSARSVKLLERSTIDEEPETRDTWWNELRLEVRSHARALACNVILGYSENTAYNDDVCILSAIGTAATIYLPSNDVHHPENITAAKKKTDVKNQNIASSLENRRGGGDNHTKRRLISENGDSSDDFPCSLCHVPFKKSSMPFRVSLSKCLHCKRCFVPEILMTTIEPPEGIPILGEGCFLQAFVKRPKRDNRGELNAKEISDSAPFLEYELHRQLLNKLRVKGMNSIFSLKITISVGDRMITGHAAGTAIYLAALPILSLPTVTLGSNQHDSSKLEKIQKDLSDSVRKNRERFLLRPPSVSGVESEALTSDSEESEVDLPEADFATGNMDLCILEVDDNEDVDLIPQLIESPPPRNLIVTAAEVLPGVDDLEAVRNLQMFTQVWRGRIPITAPLSAFNRQFRTMLHKVYFKVRDMIPCALSGIRFLVDIPEADELQITVFGMILGLAPCEKSLNRYSKRKLFMKTSNSGESVKKLDENDLIFNLEEIEDKKSLVSSSQMAGAQLTAPVASKFSGGTPAFHVRPKERYGIDITPLSFVPGGKIDRYLGNMNLFFIREGTSIRENGGIGVFIHSFVTDVLAIMRAHVAALGGNAVVAYFMNQCILQNNPNKNQAQCLINVGGDAVLVNYRGDD